LHRHLNCLLAVAERRKLQRTREAEAQSQAQPHKAHTF
jgi:hypothetical protein